MIGLAAAARVSAPVRLERAPSAARWRARRTASPPARPRAGSRGWFGSPGRLAAAALGGCAALVFGACNAGESAPTDADGAGALVVTDSEYALVGDGIRRGRVMADSLILAEDLRSGRLIRPTLTVIPSATRPQQLLIAADSGRLFVEDDRVLLFSPTSVTGASSALVGRDSVWYAPAGDSVWAAPGG